jgi:hypothetical protein
MTNPERIYAYLTQRTPSPICDDCIAAGAEVSPRQQVNPIASALGLTFIGRGALAQFAKVKSL